MGKDIRVLLIDDHQVVREGLRQMLELEDDIDVVGEAANAEEAFIQTKVLSPEVILMDIKMPDVDGIKLTRQLKAKQPSCNIIMMTLYEEYLAEAMQAGAGGYLIKDVKRKELAQAIRQVNQGEVVISEGIKSKARYNDSDTTPEEMQLIIPTSVDANYLMRFVSQVEEMFESRTLLMVSSCKGDTAITIPLPNPTPIEDVINKLIIMPEVEMAEEKAMTPQNDASLLSKTAVIPRLKIGPTKTIFVKRRNGQS